MVMLNICKKGLKKPAVESELDLDPLIYVKFTLYFSGVSLTCANITAEILLQVKTRIIYVASFFCGAPSQRILFLGH